MRYWVSFDLGLRGEYDQLFGWLDRQQAKECGDNLATFLSEKTRGELKKDLLKVFDLKRNPRVYMIDMKRGGKFICGKRKVAPWTGYGQVSSGEVDERDE
jgi:hypothetical protein